MKQDPYVFLARMALETYVKTGRMPRLPQDISDELLENKAGTFITISKQGSLRGSTGSVKATRKSLAEEILENAVRAGVQDPRFHPVSPDELPELTYHVDVIGPSEPVRNKMDIDPEHYGILVRSGWKSGMVLPVAEGVPSVDEQLSSALKKAGIRSGESYLIERFRVVRHSES